MSEQDGGLYLRTLQTIKDATEEKATTVVIPLPIEMLGALGLKGKKE